ncbi:MAG: VWA domain-containing protein [Vicinamibacterales bacterium]
MSAGPRSVVVRVALALVAVVLAAAVSHPLAGQPQTPQELPKFTSAVEVTSLDVSVFDDRGRPVTDLKPDEFVVTIDKSVRQVVSADWVQLQTPGGAPPTTVPAGYSSNEGASGGRLILIVVDQPNIRLGGTLGIRKAVNGFIDHLRPSDRTAIVGLGVGARSVGFTADRERLKKTLERLSGLHQPRPLMLHNISVSEAKDIQRGDSLTLSEVTRRECADAPGQRATPADLDACTFELQAEAREVVLSGAGDGRDTIRALGGLLDSLKAIDGPKTMMFVSEGFAVDDMHGEVAALGTRAAAARTSIYSLKLDDSLFTVDASQARVAIGRMDDRARRAEGMEILSGASRGTLINVIGNGVNVFARIESELAGYYLIGVESGAADKDGKAHPVSVSVKRPRLTVRTRRAVIGSATESTAPRTPRESVMAALATPLPMTALPIRVATYSLQGPEADRVQLLIHADVGTDYPTSRVVSMGYVITDQDGRMVDSQAATARLPPVMNGVPSPLQFSGGASLPPGDYLMKLAVSEGDRVGTVEHQIHAGLTTTGALRLSDLMVGGPTDPSAVPLRPTVGYTVVFGGVHGYLEAYGPMSNAVKTTFDIVSVRDGAAIVSADVPAYTVGSMRAIFSHVLPVRQLPPGKYLLRATLSWPQAPAQIVTNTFEVAAPAVLMSSATGADLLRREVFLPVTETLLSASFDLAAALSAETVQAFRSRVAPDKQAAFDRGVQLLAAKNYDAAEAGFKAAVSVDGESSAALAYLAATFAAAGHDLEASSAWQTSLVDGSDRPEIYEWLAGTLLRIRDLAQARGTLEEAVGKWPADLRFARPMALVYATFGQGRDAVRHLERHLSAHPDDAESALMGVEWIYQLRSAGAVSRSPADDVALARRYADVYIRTGGPQTALVKQWMEFLERR